MIQLYLNLPIKQGGFWLIVLHQSLKKKKKLTRKTLELILILTVFWKKVNIKELNMQKSLMPIN